jgi:hypothetical protein
MQIESEGSTENMNLLASHYTMVKETSTENEDQEQLCSSRYLIRDFPEDLGPRAGIPLGYLFEMRFPGVSRAVLLLGA